MFASWWKKLVGAGPKHAARMFTRKNCGLCDEAAETLHAAGFDVEFIDIDDDPDLVEQFGCEIPVVEIEGKIRFRGRVNDVLLRRIVRRELSGRASGDDA